MKSILTIASIIAINFYSISQNLSLQWAIDMGSSNDDVAYSSTTDTSGNVYVTGYFRGTVDFDPSSSSFFLTSNGVHDIFIQKLDAWGNFIWAKKIGGTSIDLGSSIEVDSLGNVYVIGEFSGSVDFNPGSGTNNLISLVARDMFILKLNSAGNFIWARSINAVGRALNGNQTAHLAIDSQNNLCITNSFSGTVDFDPGVGVSLLTANGLVDAFVLKLSSAGSFIWAKKMGGLLASTEGFSISTDLNNDIAITGAFIGTVDFNPGTGTNNLSSALNSSSTFILKLSSNGNYVWAKSISNSPLNKGYAISSDHFGDVFVTGFFAGITDFNVGTGVYNLTSIGNSDMYVLKLSSSGNFIWATHAGGVSGGINAPTSHARGMGISNDVAGHVLVTGFFAYTTDFDPGPGVHNLTASSFNSIYILKLSNQGAFMWAEKFDGSPQNLSQGSGIGRSIHADEDNNVYVAGLFHDTVDFDPSQSVFNLFSSSSSDAFVLKLCQCSSQSAQIISDSVYCINSVMNLYISDTTNVDSVYWTFGDTASGTSNHSNLFSPNHTFSQIGLYPIEVVTYCNCIIDTLFDTIMINATPIAFLPQDTTLCEGDSIHILSSDTSYTYLWSTGDTTNSIAILSSGTYTLIISNSCGVTFDTIIIDSVISSLISLPNDTLLCLGDSLLLDATITNATYLWNTTDTLSSIWVDTQGIYSITATNICNTVSDTIEVDFTHIPIINLGNDTNLCNGDSITLYAWDTLSTYLWNTGDTSNILMVQNGGIYSVTVSNFCGTISDTTQITYITPPNINLGSDTLLCLIDSLLLDVFTPNSTYQWNTNDTSNSIWINSQGMYSVTVTSSNACPPETDSVNIFFTHPPNINLGNDSILCNGASLILDGWDTLSTFLWNSGDTVSSILTDSTGIFSVVTTNLCGTDTDTIQLWFIDPPTVSLGNDTILCPNATIVLRDTSSAFPTYSWNSGSGFDSALVAWPGVYQLTVTNVCGVASDTVEVWYDNSPVTNLGPDARYCITNLLNLDAYWSRATYLWNTADTTHDITANYDGQYWVQVTNLCGYDDDTVNIAYDMPINFNLGTDTVLCQGNSIALAAPAHNANWTWQDGSTDSILVANQAGTFWVSANNFCGTFSDTIHVSGEALPLISNPINDTTICSNEEFIVTVPVNNATSILWSDGSIQYQRTFANANDYSYQLFNICGQAIDSFKVVVEHPLEFGLGNDTVICYGEEFDKVLNYPNHTFLWNDGSTNNFQTITRTGVYGVTIWTSANCESYDEFEVTACTTQLFIPNAFTPGNGDDLNNTFKIKGVGIRAFQIVIYDRWGQQVFESTDLDNSWDGTSRASVSSNSGASSNSAPEAPAGVYTYKIWYNTGDGTNRVSKLGVVNLIR